MNVGVLKYRQQRIILCLSIKIENNRQKVLIIEINDMKYNEYRNGGPHQDPYNYIIWYKIVSL